MSDIITNPKIRHTHAERIIRMLFTLLSGNLNKPNEIMLAVYGGFVMQYFMNNPFDFNDIDIAVFTSFFKEKTKEYVYREISNILPFSYNSTYWVKVKYALKIAGYALKDDTFKTFRDNYSMSDFLSFYNMKFEIISYHEEIFEKSIILDFTVHGEEYETFIKYFNVDFLNNQFYMMDDCIPKYRSLNKLNVNYEKIDVNVLDIIRSNRELIAIPVFHFNCEHKNDINVINNCYYHSCSLLCDHDNKLYNIFDILTKRFIKMLDKNFTMPEYTINDKINHLIVYRSTPQLSKFIKTWTDCSICCTDDYPFGVDVIRTMCCGRIFHIECIKQSVLHYYNQIKNRKNISNKINKHYKCPSGCGSIYPFVKISCEMIDD